MFSILSLKIRVCPRVLRRQLSLRRTPSYHNNPLQEVKARQRGYWSIPPPSFCFVYLFSHALFNLYSYYPLLVQGC